VPVPELGAMPLMDHLRELRSRLIWVGVAVLAGMMLGLLFAEPLIKALTAMCVDCTITYNTPTGAFISYFQIGLRVGIVVASPVILYQIHAFIAPALHPHEKRYLNLFVPGGALLFFVGIACGWFLVLPRTVDFLGTFGPRIGIQPYWTIDSYLALVTNLLLAVGVAFMTPLVVYLLAKIGLVTPAFLRHYRRYFIVIAAVLAAVLTPTPDPFTMFMVLIPMVALYEMGILMARFL
jgi:sec-independent protein translocase protein TatC